MRSGCGRIADAGHGADRKLRTRALVAIAVVACILAAILGAQGRALAAPAEPYFLVATHDLIDPIFGESVILILPVAESGVLLGVIINKPTKLRVQDLVSGAPVLAKPAETAFFGGPVEVNTPALLVRSNHPLAKAMHVFEDVYLFADTASINAYVKAPPEANGVRLIVGRSQWMPDQLQSEIAEGSWYKAPAEVETIFSPDPNKVWGKLVQRGQLQEAGSGGPTSPIRTLREVVYFDRVGFDLSRDTGNVQR